MAANTKSKVIYLIINSVANKGKLSLRQASPSLLFWGRRIAMNTLPAIAFGSTELSAQLLVGALGEWLVTLNEQVTSGFGRRRCPSRSFCSTPLIRWVFGDFWVCLVSSVISGCCTSWKGTRTLRLESLLKRYSSLSVWWKCSGRVLTKADSKPQAQGSDW